MAKGIVKDYDEDLSYPPTLEGEIQKLKDEIAKRDRIIEAFENDGEHAMFWALNRKQNEAARSLNSFELNFKADKDDKSFERYSILMNKLPEHTAAVHLLRTQYLKIPEDKLQEAEQKGIPLIEQIGKRRNKK